MQPTLTRVSSVDSGRMPSSCSDASRESGLDKGATAVLTCATSPARLGLRTYEKHNKKENVCIFEMKDAPCERLVSGVLQLLVLTRTGFRINPQKVGVRQTYPSRLNASPGAYHCFKRENKHFRSGKQSHDKKTSKL
jgi:hypothetical protein